MQTPDGVDGVVVRKSLSLLKDFQTATASMSRKRRFASSARGFLGFCFFGRHSFFSEYLPQNKTKKTCGDTGISVMHGRRHDGGIYPIYNICDAENG